MNKNFFLFLAVVIATLLFTQCQKGDTGPQGPQGPKGPVGPQGPTGTANVIYSQWFEPSWLDDTLSGIHEIYADVKAPSLTQPVLDSGAVIVFGNLFGYFDPNKWPVVQETGAQLPITLTYILSGTTMTDTWSASFALDTIRISFVNDHNIYASLPSNGFKFRYVIIPAGVAGTSANTHNAEGGNVSSLKEQLKKMTYENICQLFNIPE
jgi:hypothetical protein